MTFKFIQAALRLRGKACAPPFKFRWCWCSLISVGVTFSHSNACRTRKPRSCKHQVEVICILPRESTEAEEGLCTFTKPLGNWIHDKDAIQLFLFMFALDGSSQPFRFNIFYVSWKLWLPLNAARRALKWFTAYRKQRSFVKHPLIAFCLEIDPLIIYSSKPNMSPYTFCDFIILMENYSRSSLLHKRLHRI